MNIAPPDTPERIRELIGLFGRTHYNVTLPDATPETLRVSALPPPAIIRWLDHSAFAVYLTACNPWSRTLGEAENSARLAQLRDTLHDADARILEGNAGIPGQTWCEPSLLVANVALETIDRLARMYEQNASVRVYPARAARLRLHRQDWRKVLSAMPDCEWASA